MNMSLITWKSIWFAQNHWLDLLQGENNTYYGIMLLCLVALRRKLQFLVKKDWIFCKPLSEAFLNAVENKFNDSFNFTTSTTENAAICFKLSTIQKSLDTLYRFMLS